MKFLYQKFAGALLAVLLLTAASVSAQQADYNEYRPLLLKNALRLGITATDINEAVITNAYTDASTQVTYIYLQQAYQQVKVYNTIITTAFSNGSFLYASGNFVKDIASKAAGSQPSKQYAEAIKAAARHLKLNENAPLSLVNDLFTTDKKYLVAAPAIAKRDIEVALYWQPSDDKQQVSLTWNVNIDVLGSSDWWNVRINAMTGDYLVKDNWTVEEKNIFPESVSAKATNDVVSETEIKTPVAINKAVNTFAPPTVTSANYRVYPFPYESPNFIAATTVNNPWLLAGAGNNATTNGWHFDGTTNYNITRGNNVFAFLDRRANNVSDASRNWPDTSSTAIPLLNFIHNINPAVQPWLNTENKKAALDNLFYWNNLMHDVMYQYGLTEAGGSFQADNLSRGGLGNDYVNANAQDSAGYSNANFSTPIDGSSGRMQMYTWTGTTQFNINSPAGIAGQYPATENSFTAPDKLIDVGPITALCALYNDDAGGTNHFGCVVAANPAALAGKIALIDATGCNFIIKVKNAQNAGAVGAMLYYPTLLGLGGTDATVTIPCVSITTAVANSIIAQLNASVPVSVTLASGIYLDGDLDNGIICHEYGHGVSNRLTGGPANTSCLNNAEQGGEGWSDYFALMMTTNWNTATLTDGPIARPMGTYAFNQPANGNGIRRYPYSTNLTINPLTYTNMAANTEVHAIGEIWCAALWDMTWNIIQQTGSITTNIYNNAGAGGNSIALNLVMTGLKLQPCGPGFLDARNAILAADSILYNNAHRCAIWNAFARRGMGFSAKEGSPDNAADQTAATDLPAAVRLIGTDPVSVTKSTQTTITHTATCDCQAITGYVLRDTIPSGFTYVSSIPAGTLNGNVLSFPAANFTASETRNFSITLTAPATNCLIDSVINDNRETNTTGGLVSAGAPGWTTSTTKPHSGTTSWFVTDPSATGSSTLTSGSVAATAAQNLSILSFYHYFNIENGYDAGVVEYSTDGTTWLDAGSLIYRNPYNTTILAGTLIGKTAFSGSNNDYRQTFADVSSLGTTSVAFRFRMISDNAIGSIGWYVDDVVRANGCGGILKSGLYSNTAVRVDTVVTPMFVTPGTVPLTLLWFYAGQVGNQVTLDWKTVSEINVKNFTVEWSSNGINWSSLGDITAQNRNSNSYNFLHANPVSGNNYYRIKMNDIDGHFTYSPVRIINLQNKGVPMLVLVPNPVNSDAMLYFSKDINARSISIYNAAGSLVRQISVTAGTQKIQLSTMDLSSGIYTIETNGADRYITRMTVQH
ncbi:MAG: M36 family metallopeptidase [Ferruginibacter sp.]